MDIPTAVDHSPPERAARSLRFDTAACLVALVFGVAGGAALLLLAELIRYGSLSASFAIYAPIFSLIYLVLGLLGAGLAVVAATAVRSRARTERSDELEALSGGAVAGVVTVLAMYSLVGMAGVLPIALTGPPVAIFTWLALRKSGAIAALRN